MKRSLSDALSTVVVTLLLAFAAWVVFFSK